MQGFREALVKLMAGQIPEKTGHEGINLVYMDDKPCFYDEVCIIACADVVFNVATAVYLTPVRCTDSKKVWS